jgi:hypothetical protein
MKKLDEKYYIQTKDEKPSNSLVHPNLDPSSLVHGEPSFSLGALNLQSHTIMPWNGLGLAHYVVCIA